MSLTAIEIANQIAQKVIHMDAQTTGNHPILSEIYAEMSSVERILAGLEPWTWLKSTVDVNGYAVDTTADTIQAGFYTQEATGLRTQATASKTEYYAQRITTDDYLVSMINVPISLKVGGTGIGAPSGTISLYICPDVNGAPDINNPVMTADLLSLALNGTAWVTQTFLFTGTSTVLLKNTNYWIVFKWVGAADNGDSMFVAVDSTTDTAATSFKTRLNNATTWTTQTGYLLAFTLNYYQSDYIDTITMPSSVVDVFEMHTGDETDRPVSLIQYANDRFIQSGIDLPVDTYCVRKVSGNTLTIYHNSGTPSLVFHCEVLLFPTQITTDSQVMLCPDAGIEYIIYTSAANLGTDILDEKTINRFLQFAAVVKENMEFRYISKTQGRRVERSAFTRGGIEQTRGLQRRTSLPR